MLRLLTARATVLVSAAVVATTILAACSDLPGGPTGTDTSTPVAETLFKRDNLPRNSRNAVASLAILPSDFTVAATQQATLAVEARNSTGRLVGSVTPIWSSSDPTVASVSSGVVRGLKPGVALIMATSAGISDTATATVSAVTLPVSSMTVTPTSANVIVGQNMPVTANVLAADGSTLAGQTVTWNSSNRSVATVSSTGSITGVAPGTAQVQATSSGLSSTVAVTVSPVPAVPVGSVTVTPSPATVVAGSTVQLTAATLDANGAALTGRSISWSSSDQNILKVSATGLVTGVAAGSAAITATSEGQTGTSTVQVTPSVVAVASVALSSTSASLTVGQSVQLVATAKDAAGNTLTGRTTSWTSSSASVASVSSSGLVGAVSAGSATITATVEGRSATAAVAVSSASAPPPPPPTTRAGYYVAANGSSGGNGSISSPWDLASVLSGNKGVTAGDTVWVRGGTYRGQFINYMNGNSSQQIVVRQYPRERATIDGTILVMGSYVSFWGLEVMSSSPTSSSSIGVNMKAPGSRLINMVIHDAGVSGVGAWNEAPNAQVYGSLIYNNGTHANLDHGIYFNGSSGTKYITDNIVFDNWAYGLHAYSSTSGELSNLRLDGNVTFNNGSIGSYSHSPDMYVGGSTVSNLYVNRNMTWRPNDGELTVWLGDGPGGSGFTYTGNYTVGNTSIGSFSGATQSGNTAWSASSRPTSGLSVIVRPNQYEAGRANIIVYNWGNQGSASADLSAVLRSGDTYEVRDAQAFYGSPVAQGTYNGGSVSLPMTAVSPPAPIGRSGNSPTSTGTQFHVFVVLKTN